MGNPFQNRSEEYLKKMLKGKQLFNHLIKCGFFPEPWVLPPFLKIIQTKKTGRGDEKTRYNIDLFAPKSNFKWREFSVIHPSNFEKVCENICSTEYEKVLQNLSEGSKIFSYSLPQKFNKDSERSASQITQWHNLQEDLMRCISDFEYLLIVDIGNCYHSMYTHVIEWACEKAGFKNFGKKLDTSIRRGMNNRTHGLPVGPRITDYIAEIVLCCVDRDIENDNKVNRYIGGRFKDNYYLMCESKTDAEMLLKIISKCLRQYHFSINSEKTSIMDIQFYFNNFWQVDYDALIHQFGLTIKNDDGKIREVDIEKIDSFISLILRLSKSFENERAVIEKTLALLNQIRPLKKYYGRYFYIIVRMYKDRIPAIPKILSLLSSLVTEDEKCSNLFKSFLVNRLKKAFDTYDDFEALWIAYFLSKNNYLNDSLIKKLEENNHQLVKLIGLYCKNQLSGKIYKKDLTEELWPSKNKSKFKIIFSPFRDSQNISQILNVDFSY